MMSKSALRIILVSILFAASWSASPARAAHPASPVASLQAAKMHEFHGIVRAIQRGELSLTLRTGRTIEIDVREALAKHHAVNLFPGRPVVARVTIAADGSYRADAILKSHMDSAFWPADR